MIDFYRNRNVTVTGGASFIGSHVVDELLKMEASVTVIDDFSSGSLSNLSTHKGNTRLRIVEKDLRATHGLDPELFSADVVIHLAAIHGGRGYIDTFEYRMFENFVIDRNVIEACADRAEMVVHASSACAYPTTLQADSDSRTLLIEDTAGFERAEQSFPDGAYGWSKLLGERHFETAARLGLFRARSARLFTAYGERENESHAAVALIAKALLRMDPYPIWGDGRQTRNFTHVSDTVKGLLLLGADQVSDPFDVFNVGTSHHATVNEFVDVVFSAIDWWPSSVDHQLDKPVGVASRASSNQKILERFGWEPTFPLEDGVGRTVRWYRDWEGRSRTIDELQTRLMNR